MGLIRRIKEGGNIPLLTLVAVLRGVRDNLRTITWQPYVLSLGLTVQAIGTLESLMDITRIIAQPLLGAASDSHGRKRFLMIREAISIMMGLSLLFARSWPLLIVSVILVGLNWALLPVWNSMVAESTHPSRTGLAFSIIGSSFMLGGLIGNLSGGYIAEDLGYSMVYLLAIVFGSLSMVLVSTALTEENDIRRKNLKLREIWKPLFRSLRPPLHLRGFYISMAVDLFAFGTGFRLLYGMLSESYGYTPYMLGLMSGLMTAIVAISQILIGRYIDRIGYTRCLAISQLLACIFLGMVIFSKKFGTLLVGMVVMGLASAFWGPAEQSWITQNVDPGERAQSIGSYATFRALLSFPAPTLGGYLHTNYGFNIPILINLILASINIPMILTIIPRSRNN
jgi:DHA1 family tetracycline resistance protein-like MFS transporter